MHLIETDIVVVGGGGLRELIDSQVNLPVDKEVQPQHVMRSLAKAATIDPAPVAEFVAFPRLPNDDPEQ